MKSKNPLVSVLVLNYNGREHLGECFNSLKEQTYPCYEVIMVDNGSKDDSIEFVRDNFRWVKILALDRNYGFSEGNNKGVEHAEGELVVFLNNDTRVDRNWLRELVDVMESDAEIGICGSKMLMYSHPEFINSTGAEMSLLSGYFWDRGIYEKDRGQYDLGGDVLSVCAGAMLVRKRVFLDLGGFQKEFFAYYEDVDLCIKCWIYGFKVVYAPSAVVYHKLGASFKHVSGGIPEDMDRSRSEFVISLSERNRWYIYLTKFSLSTLVIYLPIFLFYYFFASSWLLFLQLFLKRYYGYNYSRTLVHLKALWYNIRNFPRILRDRKVIQTNRVRSDRCFLGFLDYQLIPARKTGDWKELEKNVDV